MTSTTPPTASIPHQGTRLPWKAWAILALGDFLVFVLFNILGRTDHAIPISPQTTLQGVAPFVLAWFAVAPWLGIYRRSTFTSLRQTWLRMLPVWLVSGMLALLLRIWWYDRPFIFSFAAIALTFQGAMVLGWRLVFLFVARRRQV
ncbi:MAG: DUF3054 domain-containing protein [Chloroflexi bacterium]|nr:DUF3054 domain-containing protein [Chloroflexota bacterium]